MGQLAPLRLGDIKFDQSGAALREMRDAKHEALRAAGLCTLESS
jgi:hypothetical protein